MVNKKVVFTNHAKERAFQRLNIKHDRFSLLFEVELNNIFKKSVKVISPQCDKTQYEAIVDGKKIVFICDCKNNEIIVNTIMVK